MMRDKLDSYVIKNVVVDPSSNSGGGNLFLTSCRYLWKRYISIFVSQLQVNRRSDCLLFLSFGESTSLIEGKL